MVAQLIKTGKVEHAAIGIVARPITPDLARTFRLPVKSGVLVEDVQAGSGAAKAGSRPAQTNVTVAGESYKLGGDIIVAVDGCRVHDTRPACATSSPMKKPGDTITLKIYRGESRRQSR